MSSNPYELLKSLADKDPYAAKSTTKSYTTPSWEDTVYASCEIKIKPVNEKTEMLMALKDDGIRDKLPNCISDLKCSLIDSNQAIVEFTLFILDNDKFSDWDKFLRGDDGFVIVQEYGETHTDSYSVKFKSRVTGFSSEGYENIPSYRYTFEGKYLNG